MSTRTPRSVAKQRRRTPTRSPAVKQARRDVPDKPSPPLIQPKAPSQTKPLSGLQGAGVFAGALLLLLLAAGCLSVLLSARNGKEEIPATAKESKPVAASRPLAETWALERNMLSLENGAIVLDMSPLPAPRGSILRNAAVRLSNMTMPFALTSKADRHEERCWFLPPPTGSGQIQIKLKGCQRLSRFAYDMHGGIKDSDPVRISLWAKGNQIAVLEPLKHISSVYIDKYQPCADQVAIYVTGKGKEPGSCVRKLVLV